MNITTRSGKTITVDDESYLLDFGDGIPKHIFTSAQERRMYMIDDADIEIFDEEWVDERLEAIIRMAGNMHTPSGGYPPIMYA